VCLVPLPFLRKSESAVTRNVRQLPTGPARLIRALLESNKRINSVRDFVLENQGLSPIAELPVFTILRCTVNPRIAMVWPQAVRPAAKIKSKQIPLKKRRRGRFEDIVARYYRGVCTFASRLTDDPVEAVLLTHAAFTSARKLLRRRDEVRLVTILLTAVMRAAQLAKLRGLNLATRVHADKPVLEPKNRADRRRCSPRCPICLEHG
jgi:hypothetical protein